jgi:RNA polymerase sigma factor (sigma-70 family)
VSDFDLFFAAHYERVVGSLCLACGALGDAEDAAQEAFAKALVRWRSVSAMERPSTWVYVVAVRELRRRNRRHGRMFAPGPGDGGSEVAAAGVEAGDVADVVVTGAVLAAALAALPPRQRLAVVLRFHGDLTVNDVARAMGCSPGTVKSALHAALARLRVQLGDRDLEGAIDGS